MLCPLWPRKANGLATPDSLTLGSKDPFVTRHQKGDSGGMRIPNPLPHILQETAWIATHSPLKPSYT